MKNFFRTAAALLLTAMAARTTAQTAPVTGRVLGAEDGAGLPGVSVVVKGTPNRGGPFTDNSKDNLYLP